MRRIFLLPLGAVLLLGTCGVDTGCSDGEQCGPAGGACPMGSELASGCSPCAADKPAYCTWELGLSGPLQCTTTTFHCVPVGSGGASCVAFFCCPSS